MADWDSSSWAATRFSAEVLAASPASLVRLIHDKRADGRDDGGDSHNDRCDLDGRSIHNRREYFT